MVSRIENHKRGFSEDELQALAWSLETTKHWLTSGHGAEGEPVVLFGTPAEIRVGKDEFASLLASFSRD